MTYIAILNASFCFRSKVRFFIIVILAAHARSSNCALHRLRQQLFGSVEEKVIYN